MAVAVPSKLRVLVLTLSTVATLVMPAVGQQPAGSAAPPNFANDPTVKAEESAFRIDFTADRATDVVVEIMAGEKIVRHLAAGALGGKNPPPPPLVAGLKQSLVWDGKDDAGKPVAGPCQVRVRLGLAVEFDRIIASKKNAGNNDSLINGGLANYEKNGLAVDSRGNIYVALCYGSSGIAGRSEGRLVVLSPEGKYLRTIVPFRANTDAEKLRGIDFISSQPAQLTPRIYERVCTTVMPQIESLAVMTMAMTSDDRLVFPSGWRTELYGFGPRVLLMLNADGSVPRERVNGPVIAEGIVGAHLHVAISPDDKYAYVTGFSDGRYYDPYKNPKTLQHKVLRVELKLDAKPELFFGKHKTAGGGEELLNDPRGVAVDGKGLVYVSDHGNDRVVVLSPEGRFVREMKVVGPTQLVVHRATGSAYVVCVAPDTKVSLVKLAADGKEVWRLPAGASRRDSTQYYPSVAIDPSGNEPVILLGSNNIYLKYRLLRVVDKGERFETSELLPPVDYFGDAVVAVTPDDTLYVRCQGVGQAAAAFLEDGASGQRTPWWPKYYDRAFVGRDGMCYTYKSDKSRYGQVWLERSTLARQLVPFPTQDKCSEASKGLFWAGRRANLFVGATGDFYYLEYLQQGGGDAQIVRYTADGNRAATPVTGLLGPLGVKVDKHGNIYTADNLKPAGVYWPSELDPFISTLDKKGQDEYAETYGSILKFGPKGGSVAPAAGDTPGTRVMELCRGEKKFAVQGLADSWVGISPVAPLRAGFKSKCWCLGANFDLDPHDRLFVPDSARFCVHVIDANFNPILTFGGYDSVDAPQGKANAPGPEISFECPLNVAVSDAAAYVYDAAPCARRTMRIKLTYAAERSCPIR